MRWLKDLVTGIDNQTHDLGRWSWVFSTFGVLAAASANWAHGHEIDLTALGTALAAVVTAHGAALFLKKDTEPK